MDHTRTPWYVADTGNHQGLIIAENTGENVAVTYDKANAPLIVKCCNNYEDMKGILRELAQWENDPDHYAGDLADLAHEAKAILQRIEKGQ